MGDMSTAHKAMRQRMTTAERSFREEQAQAIEKFLAEQRRIFEDSLLFANNEVEAFRSVPAPRQGEQGLLKFHSRTSSNESDSSEDTQDPLENGQMMHVSESQMSLMEVTKKIKIKTHTKLQKFLLPIVESGMFNVFSSMIVISACFQLGFDAHYTMLSHFDDEPRGHIIRILRYWQIANVIMFMIEMAIRFAAEQVAFCCGPNRRWNIFDCCLLVIQIIMVFYPHNSLGQIRMARLIRLIRVFEIFPDLRMMLYSLVACTQSMVWALVLIFTFFWMFACYLMETSALYLSEISVENKDILKKHWNGLSLSLQSLLYSVTGGADWGHLAEPFFAMGPINGWFYCLFIVTTLLGFLNVLIGIFMQKTNDIGSWDRDVILGHALQTHKDDVSDLHQLFQEIDVDGSGEISNEEFTRAMSQPRFRAYFHHLQIHLADPRQFFKYLDINGDDQVDMQEFTDGCLRLQGAAKPSDVTELLHVCRNVANKLDRLSGMPSRFVAS